MPEATTLPLPNTSYVTMLVLLHWIWWRYWVWTSDRALQV